MEEGREEEEGEEEGQEKQMENEVIRGIIAGVPKEADADGGGVIRNAASIAPSSNAGEILSTILSSELGGRMV